VHTAGRDARKDESDGHAYSRANPVPVRHRRKSPYFASRPIGRSLAVRQRVPNRGNGGAGWRDSLGSHPALRRQLPTHGELHSGVSGSPISAVAAVRSDWNYDRCLLTNRRYCVGQSLSVAI
jgi:hypothetical protein